MLVLTRRVEEEVMIGDDIRIKVLGFKQGEGGERRVKLGIEAPRQLPIVREEAKNKVPRSPSESRKE